MDFFSRKQENKKRFVFFLSHPHLLFTLSRGDSGLHRGSNSSLQSKLYLYRPLISNASLCLSVLLRFYYDLSVVSKDSKAKSSEPYLRGIKSNMLVTGVTESNKGYTQDNVVVSNPWKPEYKSIKVPMCPGRWVNDVAKLKSSR